MTEEPTSNDIHKHYQITASNGNLFSDGIMLEKTVTSFFKKIVLVFSIRKFS